MTLLEMMVDKKVFWPDGATHAAQDSSEAYHSNVLCFYTAKPHLKGEYYNCYGDYLDSHGVFLDDLASDWNTSIITREQYEEALLGVVECVVSETSKPYKQVDVEYEHTLLLEIKRVECVMENSVDKHLLGNLKEHHKLLLEEMRKGLFTQDVVAHTTKVVPYEHGVVVNSWEDLQEGDLVKVLSEHHIYDIGHVGEFNRKDNNNSHSIAVWDSNKSDYHYVASWAFVSRPTKQSK